MVLKLFNFIFVADYLKIGSMFGTGNSNVKDNVCTAGYLERQTGKINLATSTMSTPLSHNHSCSSTQIISDRPRVSLPTKSLSISKPVLLPAYFKLAEIQDPRCLIKSLRIGDNLETIGIVPFEDLKPVKTNDMLASSVLKKRKRKMNRHKYKKRRARDKFKRLNLQNIKDRKQRAKDRAKERMAS